jgi:hypothetical protein
MSFRRAARSAGTSLILFASVAALATGCGSSSSTNGTGGKTGSGGALGAGAGGHLGTGGTGTGTGGVIVDAGPILPQCVPAIALASDQNILDFSGLAAGAGQANYGSFGAFGGGTFEYPENSAPAGSPVTGITSDFSGGNWHITGLVAAYSGFGLYLYCKSDVSAFTGLQFDIGGTFTPNGVGDGGIPAPRVTLGISQPADELDTAHAMMPPTWGTCAVNCNAPARAVPITSATPVTVTVPFTSFVGGTPVGPLDPTAITGFFFTLPWNGVGPQFTIDLTIDNIKFTSASTPPPPDAGTGTGDAAADTVTTDTATDTATD